MRALSLTPTIKDIRRAAARILGQVFPGRSVEALREFVDAGNVRRVL